MQESNVFAQRENLYYWYKGNTYCLNPYNISNGRWQFSLPGRNMKPHSWGILYSARALTLSGVREGASLHPLQTESLAHWRSRKDRDGMCQTARAQVYSFSGFSGKSFSDCHVLHIGNQWTSRVFYQVFLKLEFSCNCINAIIFKFYLFWSFIFALLFCGLFTV